MRVCVTVNTVVFTVTNVNGGLKNWKDDSFYVSLLTVVSQGLVAQPRALGKLESFIRLS